MLRSHAERFPDLLPDPTLADGLDPREAGLARAITDATVRRWLTLRFLIGRFTNGPLDRLEPGVLAGLLAGTSQIALLDRVPPHAAINETVEWVKRRVRQRAGGLVNAVLRRVGELAPSDLEPRDNWTDASDELLLSDGRARTLTEAVFPDSESDRISLTTSVPLRTFTAWADDRGWKEAKRLAFNAMTVPPLLVNACHATASLESAFLTPHEEDGFFIFDGPRDTLSALLSDRADLWVQDPGSARSVGIAEGLKPRSIIDVCAGKGTKTRQLRELFPGAKIVASDTDRARARDFADMVVATGMQDAIWERPEDLEASAPADLILLDVPCSNSGVLARRPEARYRLGTKQTKRLNAIQDDLLARGAALCASGGHVLYATCSIDEAENGAMVERAARHGLIEVRRRETLPRGAPGDEAAAHLDGGFASLLRKG